MAHALDMIGRDKNNMALRKTYRDRFNKLKEKHFENIKLYSGNIKFDKKPKQDLENIKEQFRGSLIRERRLAIEKTIFVTAVVIVIFLWLFFGVLI